MGTMPARAFCSMTTKRTPNANNFELRAVACEYGKHVLQGVLEQRDDGRADHTAPAMWPAPPTSAISRSSMLGRMSNGAGFT